MSKRDHRPRQDTPVTTHLSEHHDNRLGAVYSSLFAFWTARQGPGRDPRRDTYSVVLFNQNIYHAVIDNTTSTAEELLTGLLRFQPGFGTNFQIAIEAAQTRMDAHWDDERSVKCPLLLPYIVY